MKNKIALFLVLNVIVTFSSGQEADLYNYDNSLKFANYLYSNAEYSMAVKEYKRVLFLSPENTIAAIRLHDSYIRSGNFREGLDYALSSYHPKILNDTLFLLQGKLLLLNKDYTSFQTYKNNISLNQDMDLFLDISEAMFQRDWSRALLLLPQSESVVELQQISPLIQKTEFIKYKSPGLGLAMSAIIPGTGKMYSGYWKDGIFSLLFVGITAWQSYRGFKLHGPNSAYGWIMGGISLSFYAGNLYGTVKAVNKRNHETDHQILHAYEKAFIDTYSDF